MKTIKILLGILFLTSSICIAAQTFYYKADKEFVEDGYTYICESSGEIAFLYNKENEMPHAQIKYKNGDDYTPALKNDPNLLDIKFWNKALIDSVVFNSLSFIKKDKIETGKESLDIILYINSEEGTIDGVKFRVSQNNLFGTIPISVFRNIELKLKENIRFTPTEEGKKMNCISIHYSTARMKDDHKIRYNFFW